MMFLEELLPPGSQLYKKLFTAQNSGTVDGNIPLLLISQSDTSAAPSCLLSFLLSSCPQRRVLQQEA